MWRFVRTVMVIASLVIAAVACGGGGPPKVESVELARGFKDGKAVDVTITFKTSDRELYAVTRLSSAPQGLKLKAVWTYVGADQPVTQALGSARGRCRCQSAPTL
jgi:hypothetical protein